MPCDFNNRVPDAKVKEGIRAAGGTTMELNTIAISTASRWAPPACAPRWSPAS